MKGLNSNIVTILVFCFFGDGVLVVIYYLHLALAS